MTDVIVVERSFEEPVGFDDLQAREATVAWCLDQHGVEYVCSYFALDGRAMICIYRAPDVEAVRATQRVAGLPVTRAWAATRVGGDPRPVAPPRTMYIAERTFPEPVTPQLVQDTLVSHGHCLQFHDVELLASHVAHDGLRMLCVFAAPDGEAIRVSNRNVQLPVDRLWPATMHGR